MDRDILGFADDAMKCSKKCGRNVSANKVYCMRCVEEMAQATVEAREEEPMDGITHIITKFASKNQEDLYRADGMLVASRQGDVVRFGHDIATAQSRLFLNADFAAQWLRKLATFDRACEAKGRPLWELIHSMPKGLAPAAIEERDSESLLTMPGNHTQVRLT